MKITISTLFFYDKSLSEEFIARLLPTLTGHLEAFPGDQIKLMLTDNTPASEQILEALALQVSAFPPHRGLDIEALRNDANLGFGKSHNQNFEKDDADAFVLLNNDLFFDDETWLSRLLAPLFRNEKTALSGLRNAPRILLPSGNGIWAKRADAPSDYLEGSALAVKRSIVGKYGLFALDLPWAYFEDSDLSLRYRQMGCDVATVEIPHEHRRSSSTQKIPKATLLSVRERNRSRFLSRWSGYLSHRKFANRVLLDLRTDGWGDVAASLPSVFRILKDHPTAQVDVRLENAALREFFELERVTVQVKKRESPQSKDTTGYDRTFFLSEVDFTSPLYLGAQIAASLGVDYDVSQARSFYKDKFSKLHSDVLRPIFSQAKKIAVIHAESQRLEWEGRAVAPETLIKAIELIKDRGYFAVVTGANADAMGSPERALADACDYSLIGRTSLPELAALLSRSDLYFGIDSGPLHIAQLLGVSTFAIFGATLASSKLLVEEGHTGFSDTALECLGCYHLKRGDSYNFCIRRDQACVKKLDAGSVASALKVHLDTARQKPKYPVSLERKIYALKIEPTLRIRSTIDEYRFKELCAAFKTKITRMITDRLWK